LWDLQSFLQYIIVRIHPKSHLFKKKAGDVESGVLTQYIQSPAPQKINT
jgi:hypothetical protein